MDGKLKFAESGYEEYHFIEGIFILLISNVFFDMDIESNKLIVHMKLYTWEENTYRIGSNPNSKDVTLLD